MQEQIILKSESSRGMIMFVRLVPIFLGILLMATCLVWERPLGDWAIFASAGLGGILTLFGLTMFFTSWKQGIYVTDKKVYGTTLWGKRVDIPLDSISAVALTSLFAGVAVASSSGRISFVFLKNRDEIYSAINDLLLERQGKSSHIASQNPTGSNADELKKYKELLDSSVITQEEFDAKKKQLLGL